MKTTREASEQAKGQKRSRDGKFAPEGKPAPSAPLAPGTSQTPPDTPQERERRILSHLFGDSAVTDSGAILTSDSDLESFARDTGVSLYAIRDPMREALSVCEEVMGDDNLGGILEELGSQTAMNDGVVYQDAGGTAELLEEHIAPNLKQRIDASIRSRVFENCLFEKAEYAELPFDEEDDKWYAETMYFNTEVATDKSGNAGIKLHVAGFQGYDVETGSKIGWGNTSVFYAFPDPGMAAETINESVRNFYTL